ncbi:MAG: RodZ domain-containing protein [Pseudomonadota bacterium]
MTEEGSAENNNGTAPRAVGEQLRAAREQKGMDRQDVADQLHLRPTIIRAIEESDYETMPGDLFLKGYVRSYARLTDQDGDDLIARLDRELEPFRQEQEQAHEPTPTELIHQRKVRRRRIGGGMIAVLALVVGSWLVFQYGPWVVDSAGDAVEAVGDVELEVPEASSEADGSGDDTGESEPVSEDESETQAQESSDSASSEAGPETESETGSSSAPIALVDNPDADSGDQSPNDDDQSSDTGAQASLVITFDGACWVEVVNGNGERVVTTLAQEGDSVEYEGTGPFEVLLGNVDAVSGLRFMGESVDLEQYPANAGRTQFVLDAANG